MSKEKKFHNLIEQSEKDEKTRVWQNIREKDTPTPQKTPKKKSIFAFLCSRRFLSWSGATVLAIILGVVGFMEILPHDIHSGTNQGGLTSGEVNEESGGDDSDSFGGDEQLKPDDSGNSSAPMDTSPGNGEEDSPEDGFVSSELENAPATSDSYEDEENMYPEAPSGDRYYGKSEYTNSVLTQTFQQMGNGLSYLDRYATETVVTFVITDNQEQEIIAYQEVYTLSECDGLISITAVKPNVTLAETFVKEDLTESKTFEGVSISYRLEKKDGIGLGYAYFVSGNFQYYVTLTENSINVSITEEYLFKFIAEMFS